MLPPLLLFSWPRSGSESAVEGPADCGVVDGAELPMSELMLRARFSGLFGDGRGRDTGLAEAVFGRTERRDSLTPDR